MKMKIRDILLLPLLFIMVVTATDTGDIKDVNNEDQLADTGPTPTTTILKPTMVGAKPAPAKSQPSPAIHPRTTTKPTTTSATTTTSPSTTITTSTTIKPTTSAPITTTASPTPAEPTVGTWNVTKPGTNITCIMAKMAIQLQMEYSENNATKKIVLNVPANATANGSCNDNITQEVLITWNATKNEQNQIYFDFMKNITSSEISLKSIGVIINSLHISNVTGPMRFYHNHSEFDVPLERSYKCNKKQVLSLGEFSQNKTNYTAVLTVSQVQIQAFLNSTTNEFGKALDCFNSTPDIVPIAVGCALAALVVIVLLAYLYGRRRSQARGYLSM